MTRACSQWGKPPPLCCPPTRSMSPQETPSFNTFLPLSVPPSSSASQPTCCVSFTFSSVTFPSFHASLWFKAAIMTISSSFNQYHRPCSTAYNRYVSASRILLRSAVSCVAFTVFGHIKVLEACRKSGFVVWEQYGYNPTPHQGDPPLDIFCQRGAINADFSERELFAFKIYSQSVPIGLRIKIVVFKLK